MDTTITILGTEIELDYEQIEKIKNNLLNESKGELAKDFANIIVRLQATGFGVEELLCYTAGTIGKLYDSEEENMIIVEDTEKRLKGEADFMYE